MGSAAPQTPNPQGHDLRTAHFRGLRRMVTAKATLSGIETIRTIKRGHIYDKPPGVKGEILFVEKLFPVSA